MWHERLEIIFDILLLNIAENTYWFVGRQLCLGVLDTLIQWSQNRLLPHFTDKATVHISNIIVRNQNDGWGNSKIQWSSRTGCFGMSSWTFKTNSVKSSIPMRQRWNLSYLHELPYHFTQKFISFYILSYHFLWTMPSIQMEWFDMSLDLWICVCPEGVPGHSR